MNSASKFVVVAFASAALFSINLLAQTGGRARGTNPSEKTMSDREKDNLRGPVRTCVSETIFPDRANLVTNTKEYSLDGKLLSTRTQAGSEWITTYEYNAAGHLRKTASGRSDKPRTERIYAYDDAGRSLSIRNTENDDRVDFRYEEGQKTATLRFDPKAHPRQDSAFGGSPFEAALGGFGVPTGGSVIVIYNESDRIVEAQVRDNENQLVSRIVRKYNPAGLITEERPVVENPVAMFLDKLPAEERAKLKTDPAGMQALNKGLSTLISP